LKEKHFGRRYTAFQLLLHFLPVSVPRCFEARKARFLIGQFYERSGQLPLASFFDMPAVLQNRFESEIVTGHRWMLSIRLIPAMKMDAAQEKYILGRGHLLDD
jgi:hypothetical protein